jgi:hypothetical protein
MMVVVWRNEARGLSIQRHRRDSSASICIVLRSEMVGTESLLVMRNNVRLGLVLGLNVQRRSLEFLMLPVPALSLVLSSTKKADNVGINPVFWHDDGFDIAMRLVSMCNNLTGGLG